MIFTFFNKIFYVILIFFVTSICLYSKTTTQLLNHISNSRIIIQYFYWNIDDNLYLAKDRGDNNISIWNYTNNRKWRPLHNTEAFDGFEKAPIVFDNISIKKNSGIIKIF